MHARSKAVQDNLRHLLLTQKSITQKLPFDVLEKTIAESIDYVKRENINARIANLAFNINGRLVLAQIYVERKNAFAPTKENRYGTSPTEYNVQVRFPFGLETSLAGQTLVIPGGGFVKILRPYHRANQTVTEDVQHDLDPEQKESVICGPGVIKHIDTNTQRITLSTVGGEEKLAFTYSAKGVDGVGGEEKLAFTHSTKGVDGVGGDNHEEEKEFDTIADYVQHSKTYGLYPLFYSQGVVNHEIRSQAVGQRWTEMSQQNRGSTYVFNITQINGDLIYSESGLPVKRLYDYQLELFQNCLTFVENLENNENAPRAGQVNMGVGAGKTFYTYTLLQQLEYRSHEAKAEHIFPSFCMAPNEDIATVSKRSIDKQGVSSGMSATAVTQKDGMPDAQFLTLYQTLSEAALAQSETMDDYLKKGIQAEILKYAREASLHPLTLINLFYAIYQAETLTKRVNLFKDSIDLKRLLLVVEGQKTLVSKTGKLGIEGLKNVLEQFTAIRKNMDQEPLFREAKTEPLKPLKINYNQTRRSINPATLTSGQLLKILREKHLTNLPAIRETVMRMACLADPEAAVLLANSGGLGNTYSDEELVQQIGRFLPTAVAQLNALARKKKHTYLEHYTLYLFLRELYTNLPYQFDLNKQLAAQGLDRDRVLYYEANEALKSHLGLVRHMEKRMQSQLASCGTVADLSLQEAKTLHRYGIKQTDNPIQAAHQLAGVASLAITGHARGNQAKLLLSHVPIFTPEGLASYFEHLDSLEGQPQFTLRERLGVYTITPLKQTIRREDIRARLTQVLLALMIADEIHKEEFRFLYEATDPIHKRIDAITQRHLGKPFAQVLPPRIGMSGTMNAVANRAFDGVTLCDLSTQKMIRLGLVKQISIHTQPLAPTEALEVKEMKQDRRAAFAKKEYALRIVVDYFTQNNTLAIRKALTGKNYETDLFTISKGLIFSKHKDEELNALIAAYFDLLIKEPHTLNTDDAALQRDLFQRINEQRAKQASILRKKIQGTHPLTTAECVQVTIYNKAHEDKPIQVQEKDPGCFYITNPPAEEKTNIQELSPARLRTLHRSAFINNIFALYLEYVLSKSSAPKEFSDLIGIQNRLHERGLSLLDNLGEKNECDNLLELIASVNPTTLTQEDVTPFIQSRIKNPQLAQLVIEGVLIHTNKPQDFARYLQQKAQAVPLQKLITSDRDEFESGTVFAMLGEEKEQTGYSHEPVGIIVDASSALIAAQQINADLPVLREGSLSPAQVPAFLESLDQLSAATFSYDEKNQVGGRALRTPYGHVKYLEYQSDLNALLADEKYADSPLAALKIETQFQDIFTSDEALARRERASLNFNRSALAALKHDTPTLADFYRAVAELNAELIVDEPSKQHYLNLMSQRLPLLWAMKYQPALAAAFFNTRDATLFGALTEELAPLLPHLLSIKEKEPPAPHWVPSLPRPSSLLIRPESPISPPQVLDLKESTTSAPHAVPPGIVLSPKSPTSPTAPHTPPLPHITPPAHRNSAPRPARRNTHPKASAWKTLAYAIGILALPTLIAGACVLACTTAPLWLSGLLIGAGISGSLAAGSYLFYSHCLPCGHSQERRTSSSVRIQSAFPPDSGPRKKSSSRNSTLSLQTPAPHGSTLSFSRIVQRQTLSGQEPGPLSGTGMPHNKNHSPDSITVRTR